ncbi:fasciclin-like arabinogalactan protein 19 [Ricinus communis]|uniref:fasciclin-like arabinogalactan protein 19 n=1 Tax=Ricinus communis TaxID=3988 RepID=UPI000772765E|nr:fasciclin-like arabinogalactan protein 19 [Ricinus communis]|eukprot:XP_015581421.1 fasciclin-like arabinogalactan protein 19 [Ricinus communis]
MAPIIHLMIITLSLLLSTVTTTATVTNQELEAALFTLRSQGYTLFPNAIATSDLRPLLLSLNSTFTLFSPPDPLLFSLDLSSPASHYVHSLLRHVSPLRLSMSQLRSIRGLPPYYLDTLVPRHRLSIDTSLVLGNGTVLETVLVDGVRVSVPDLFLSSSIAVHGLEGILVSSFGSNIEVEARAGDPPLLSPGGWSVESSPASSPSPRSDTWTKKRVWDYEGNLGKKIKIGHSKFTKFTRT